MSNYHCCEDKRCNGCNPRATYSEWTEGVHRIDPNQSAPTVDVQFTTLVAGEADE